MTRTYTIVDKSGVHARPAALVVNAASKYQEEVNIIYKEKSYTLKSIMIIMSLGIQQHETIGIEVIGDNAEQVLNELEETLKTQNLI